MAIFFISFVKLKSDSDIALNRCIKGVWLFECNDSKARAVRKIWLLRKRPEMKLKYGSGDTARK